MTKLIFGVKYADHSVPDVTKAKFKSQLEDLSNLLRKFGEISEIYQRTHVGDIMLHKLTSNKFIVQLIGSIY